MEIFYKHYELINTPYVIYANHGAFRRTCDGSKGCDVEVLDNAHTRDELFDKLNIYDALAKVV